MNLRRFVKKNYFKTVVGIKEASSSCFAFEQFLMRMLISTGFINFWKVIRAAKLILKWSHCACRGSKSLKSVSNDEYIAR